MNKKMIAGGVLGVIVLLGLLAAWQLGLFSSEPEEANLADTIAAQSNDADGSDDGDGDGDAGDSYTSTENDSSDGAAGDPSLPCSVAATSSPTADGGITSGADMAGRWEVGSSSGTFAGYRIDEILSGIELEAVGRTGSVSGALEIETADNDQFTVTSVEVAVDMTTLTSDSGIRDNQMKSQALETSQFPVACFVLTEPITLAGVAVDPEQFTIAAMGDVTIHGVTRTEQIELEATTSDGLLFVVGSTQVALADFEISPPTAPAVAGVGETATLEFSLVFGR